MAVTGPQTVTSSTAAAEAARAERPFTRLTVSISL
jgi:hypothetical protein